MKVQLVENVLKLNDEIAATNRRALRAAGVFTIDLIGAPGCGKTALLEATMWRLRDDVRVGVIAGDLATQRDGDRLGRYSDQVVQVNTGKTCHLEANHVQEAIQKLDLAQLDLLVIENVGNMICPVGFDLGQDVKVGMFSVTGGDDKAAKHPYLVCESELLLLSKVDLLNYVTFDVELFYSDIYRLKPGARVVEMSPVTGTGMDAWLEWLADGIGRAGRTRGAKLATTLSL